MSALTFELLHTDGPARRGRLHTPHGVVDTPVFMPVGTQATVKGLTPLQLEELDAQIILGNTYHLALRPGSELIAEQGGLHRFMGWPRAILTDSGGYQVYSLAPTRKITDEAAVFRSHIDGAEFILTPERAIALQEQLGADIAMCLDECPPAGGSGAESLSVRDAAGLELGRFERPSRLERDRLRDAVRRTIHWAGRCKAAHRRPDQALFGIVQGATDLKLRAECAQALVELDFSGYALGGFSVGEEPAEMVSALEASAALLPANKPRYLMGVGRPQDILEAVARGIDMFDCVLPTRNGRNAQAFTADGVLRLRNAIHRRDSAPLESGCPCYTCRKFSRAYLHHLFNADEMLGPTLLTLHNVAYYLRLMGEIRDAIVTQSFARFRSVCLARWETRT